MIPGLAFIKSVADFKNENKEDFAVIYSYFWGGNEIYAYIRFENGNGLLDAEIQREADINPDMLKDMEEYLNRKFDEFSLLYNED